MILIEDYTAMLKQTCVVSSYLLAEVFQQEARVVTVISLHQ